MFQNITKVATFFDGTKVTGKPTPHPFQSEIAAKIVENITQGRKSFIYNSVNAYDSLIK